jgi:hypothetical protein
VKIVDDRLLISHLDSPWDGKLKTGLGECQVISVAEGNYFEIYIQKVLVLAETKTVIGSKINTMDHYMGLQSKSKKKLFFYLW